VDNANLIARPSLKLILISLFRADLASMVKNPRRLLLSFLLPLLILLVTGSSKSTGHLGGSLYVIGLAIAYGLVSASVLGYALGIARDRENGVFRRLRVTPAPPWTIMVSRIGMQLLANLVMSLIVLIVGAQVHHINLSLGDYLLVLAVSILGGAIFIAIGQALVGLVKSAETVNAAGRILFIILIMLGLFGQSGALGGIWESISRWSPVGVVMTLYAGVLKLSLWGSSDWFSILAGGCYLIACVFVGIRWFRWENN